MAAESYTIAWQQSYGLKTLAFRFFNVFGPLQAANHAYAAVIPAFVSSALAGRPVTVHGDGSQTRDFVYIDTVTQLLQRAAVEKVTNDVPVNLAFGTRKSLLDVISDMEKLLGGTIRREFTPTRPGDVRDSQADNTLLSSLFPGAEPTPFIVGLEEALAWTRATAR